MQGNDQTKHMDGQDEVTILEHYIRLVEMTCIANLMTSIVMKGDVLDCKMSSVYISSSIEQIQSINAGAIENVTLYLKIWLDELCTYEKRHSISDNWWREWRITVEKLLAIYLLLEKTRHKQNFPGETTKISQLPRSNILLSAKICIIKISPAREDKEIETLALKINENFFGMYCESDNS